MIIFWGASGQAKVLRECISYTGIKLIALFDNNEDLVSPFKDVILYPGKRGFERWIRKQNNHSFINFLVAIGGDKGKDRIEIQEYLESYNITALIAKHQTAFVANSVKIGTGSQILAHASVCVEATIGRGCIINTSAVVEHECFIGDGVHIGPGANLAGCVKIGNYSTVGTGANILPRIEVGEGAIVGAGAVVTKNVPSYAIVVGNPAKVLRRIEDV